MTKYKTRREVKNRIIKWVSTPIEESEEDNQKVSETLTEEDHKDKEIARLTALVETLTKELEKQFKPKEEAPPSSDVMAVAAASTYDCYG
jgi:protease II